MELCLSFSKPSLPLGTIILKDLLSENWLLGTQDWVSG